MAVRCSRACVRVTDTEGKRHAGYGAVLTDKLTNTLEAIGAFLSKGITAVLSPPGTSGSNSQRSARVEGDLFVDSDAGRFG